jgi:hypothetical protein
MEVLGIILAFWGIGYMYQAIEDMLGFGRTLFLLAPIAVYFIVTN